MSIIVETERLYMREILPEDAEDMFEMDSDPEVRKYIDQSPNKSIDEVKEVIDYIRKQYEDYGIGRWAMVLKETNEFIGWTGFKYLTEEVSGMVNFMEFGYRMKRKHWGVGYATEGAKASLAYGFDHLGYEEVYAITDPAHNVSRKVLEKCGFRYLGMAEFREMPVTWYRVKKGEQ